MNSQTHAAQQFDIDVTPVFRMYQESVDAWKKNYEALLANAGASPVKSAPNFFGNGYERAMTDWQEVGGDVFKRLVEQQVELCRFLGHRWEAYLKLPDKLSHCKTPAEFAQLQQDFINQMGAEYMQESIKLAQPLAEFATSWTGRRPAC
ncbi:MAG TPA: phasin family protein [Hyphomicrobiales bacterium]|jgi:hypothetical protein